MRRDGNSNAETQRRREGRVLFPNFSAFVLSAPLLLSVSALRIPFHDCLFAGRG